VAPTGGTVGQVRIPVTFVNGANSIKFSNAASGTVGLDRIAIE
jgi:hypothetical protein